MAEEPAILSVSQAATLMQRLLERGLSSAWVAGEISGLSLHSRGHVYFELKDASARLSAAWWNAAVQARELKLADGLAVEALVSFTFYPPQGRAQVIVKALRAQGLGLLQQRFEELKARLEAEGLFALERKRPLPLLPRAIAIISSAEGAAVRDVIRVIRQRFPAMPLRLISAPVQGQGSAPRLAAAIRTANLLQCADLIILARGGGSAEDLWAFNEEIVARAIAASRLPLITGIGHEVDVTIADFVADLRAATPSQAAELAVQPRRVFQEALRGQRRRLAAAMAAQLQERRLLLQRRRHQLELADPRRRLQILTQHLDQLQQRLRRSATALLRAKKHRHQVLCSRLRPLSPALSLARHAQILQALRPRLAMACERRLREYAAQLAATRQRLTLLGPPATLARGYAYLTTMEGELIRSVTQAHPGQSLLLQLTDGTLRIRIEAEDS